MNFKSLDSSAWIEVLQNGPNSGHFEEMFRNPAGLVTSALAVYEVRKYCLKAQGPEIADRVTTYMRLSSVIPVDDELAAAAADFSFSNRCAMADSIILITARRHGATLWTQDVDLAGFPGVQYIPKPSN